MITQIRKGDDTDLENNQTDGDMHITFFLIAVIFFESVESLYKIDLT